MHFSFHWAINLRCLHITKYIPTLIPIRYSGITGHGGHRGELQFLYHIHSKEVDPCTMKLNPGTVTFPTEVHKDAYAHSPPNLWNVGDLRPSELTIALEVQPILVQDARFSLPSMDSSNASLRPGGEAYHSRLGL